MGSNINDYLANVDRTVDNLGRRSVAKDEELWKQRCIYKLPVWVTKVNPNAYQSRLISLGPYHYGEPHLEPMEEHKQRALVNFLRRSGKHLRDCVEAFRTGVLRALVAAYDSLLLNSTEFLVMMIRDGCFMVEIMRRDYQPGLLYAENDPVFSIHGEHLMPFIKRDMLLLENQLPLFLLSKLLSFEDPQAQQGVVADRINKLLIDFCCPLSPNRNLGVCKHILDAYRKCLLWEDQDQPIQIDVDGGRESKTPTTGESPSGILGFLFPPPPPKTWTASILLPPAKHFPPELQLPTATELHEAGITIKPSESGNIKAISFHKGSLNLPRILVDDVTEPVFLNLIAFERFHPGIRDEVTSYASFMDDLINTEKDVKLLQSLGIIHNAVGSEEALANLFNSLAKDVPLSAPDSLSIVRRQAALYSKKSWNQWRANLIHTYFSNPWTIISVIAAVLLFALTIIQTIYSIGQYYQG